MEDRSTHIIYNEVKQIVIDKNEAEKKIILAQKDLAQSYQNIANANTYLSDILLSFKDLNDRLSIIEKHLIVEKKSKTIKLGNIDILPTYYEMSIREKIVLLLEYTDEGVSAPQLLSMIFELEPDVEANFELRKKVTKNLYTTLNQQYNQKELLRDKNDNGDYIYKLYSEKSKV